MLTAKQPRPKKCRQCREIFTPAKSLQVVCTPACGLALAKVKRERERKSLATIERREIKVRREKLKSRADHLRETQAVVNEFIRLRDAHLPCVSCGRFHDGQWHAGHYRSAGGHPELRFEPLNIWRQCAPCNTHKSGDLVNYRVELIRRIGPEKVEWLEGPHEPQRYTIEDLKAIKAKYRALIREMKGRAA
jgi:hypothetical protein